MKRILSSGITIVGALLLVAGATGAFFSDTERATGNTFAAGVIDLMVGNESYYNGNVCKDVNADPLLEDWRWQGSAAYPEPGTACVVSWADTTKSLLGKLFFAFGDLKPDDEGEDTISLTVDTNDAWACMEVSLTRDDDSGNTEPELLVDTPDTVPDLWDGELADTLHFIWWADDGDNVLESDEYTARVISNGVQTLTDLATTSGPFVAALADSVTNVWTGGTGPLLAGQTYHIGKAWCFGTLTPTPVAQDGFGKTETNGPMDRGTGILCDGTALASVNKYQTDSVGLDVSFIAHQARHDSEYRCPEPYEPPVPCTITETYADEVIATDQGVRKNLSGVTADRSNPAYALGAPQSLGTPYDNPVVPNSFYALGFPTATRTASIVLSFNDNYVVNGPGDDLKLWEVTGGTSYPDERVDVYVGNTPTGPWTQVGNDVTRDATLELGVVSAARYVRIVDASNVSLFEPTADGFDLDAVQALNCIVSPAR